MNGEIQVKVYYEDTDSIGVVYHANYLKYFERGRSELINSLGEGVHAWNQRGFNFAVFKMAVTWHRPARLNDVCRVVTEMHGVTRYRAKLDQRLFRGDELLTEAQVDLVCLDEKLALRTFPPELLV